jgi:phosphoserine phosphatase RsbU/P
MVSPAPAPHHGNFRDKSAQFWQRVTEGLEVQELWSQFEKDARSSYRFYSYGLDAQTGDLRGGRRVRFIAKKLFWAIMEKLSPVRRVLLLVALVMLFFPTGGFSFSRGGQIYAVEFNPHFWAGLLLLVLLLLELADRVVMKRDLEIAKEIQSWLLPGAPLQLPGYQIAYATRPANTVAGDYYDVILRPGSAPGDTRVLFVVADVAGKSIPAAMLMATFQASLRTISNSHASLPELAAGLNRYSCTNSQGGVRYTTAFFAQLDPATGEVSHLNAGHNAPMLRRAPGAIERLETGGMPVGISPEAVYEAARTTLNPGDWLVIFTDGVIEAVNTKDEEYGEERLQRLIDSAAGVTPQEMLKRLLADLDGFVGNTPQHDDVTCLLVKRDA